MSNKNILEYAIRVTDYCNLNCNYCYARIDNPKKMEISILEKIMIDISKHSDGPITICWTGGEPLTQGPDFFAAVEHIEKKLGQDRFENIMQTNLILVNDWYIDFFKRNNFHLRTSLDLPPENHDMLRKDGDFNRSLNTVYKIRELGIPININTVLTDKNIDKTEEIFSFLKQHKITSFSVSRMVEQGNALKNKDLNVYDNKAFGEFLVKMFDLWVSDKEKPLIERITPLDKLLSACKAGSPDEKSKCFHCQSQLFAIGPTGDVYPSCNKFFAIPNTKLGNIMENKLEDILKSESRCNFINTTSIISNLICNKCEFQYLCEGGCYYIAYNTVSSGETITTREQFCKGYYLVFKRIIDYLKEGGK